MGSGETQTEIQTPAGAGIVASCRNVTKVYDTGAVALEDCTLDVRAHEFVALVGPSGCGKSTMLKLLAGIEPVSSGEALYKGRPVHGINTDVGFVTQDSNLFPWLTLQKNTEFALQMRGVAREERAQRAREWIRIAGLAGFEDNYPYQLSGGMQKRGSIIRTLVYNPDVMLMDEPFGALDAQTRMILQAELLDLWDRDRNTILFVTHDLQEAVALSDRIVLMSRAPGRILHTFDVPLSRPRNVYEIHQQAGFQEIYHEVWQHLRVQFNRLG